MNSENQKDLVEEVKRQMNDKENQKTFDQLLDEMFRSNNNK